LLLVLLRDLQGLEHEMSVLTWMMFDDVMLVEEMMERFLGLRMVVDVDIVLPRISGMRHDGGLRLRLLRRDLKLWNCCGRALLVMQRGLLG
jgi:hypothetical protein